MMESVEEGVLEETSSSRLEEEEPVVVKQEPEELTIVDYCLLCGQIAVVYNYDGNVIKKDPLCYDNSYEELFSYLCQVMGIRKNSKLKKDWNFYNDPFPFCHTCETMLSQLADMFKKMRELEMVLRTTVMEGEDKYVSEQLYDKHDGRYYEFRKHVLGVSFKGNLGSRSTGRRSLRSRQSNSRKETEDIYVTADLSPPPSVPTPPPVETSSRRASLRSNKRVRDADEEYEENFPALGETENLMEANPSSYSPPPEAAADYTYDVTDNCYDDPPEMNEITIINERSLSVAVAPTTSKIKEEVQVINPDGSLESSSTGRQLRSRRSVIQPNYLILSDSSDDEDVKVKDEDKENSVQDVIEPHKAPNITANSNNINPTGGIKRKRGRPPGSGRRNLEAGVKQNGDTKPPITRIKQKGDTKPPITRIKQKGDSKQPIPRIKQKGDSKPPIPRIARRMPKSKRCWYGQRRRKRFANAAVVNKQLKVSKIKEENGTETSERSLHAKLAKLAAAAATVDGKDEENNEYSKNVLLIKDPITENIYYRTLLFVRLDDEQCFQCSTCSDMIPYTNCIHEKFHAHFLQRHSDCYQCDLCVESRFASLPDLQRHMVYHGLAKLESGKDGTPQQRRKPYRLKHFTVRKKGNLTACPICGKPVPASGTDEYKEHYVTHLSDEERQAFLLTIKVETAEKKANVVQRKKRKLWTKSALKDPDYKNNNNLKGSKRGRRRGMNKPPNPDPTSKKKSGYWMQCQVCEEYISNGKCGMKKHQETHLPGEKRATFLCAICGVTFLHNISLESHMRTKHANVANGSDLYKCMYPSCTESFVTENNLQTHIQEAHGQQYVDKQGEVGEFMCQLCGRVFATQARLKRHEVVHTADKNFKCPTCPASFGHKNTLADHLTTSHNEGEKKGKFACDQPDCGETFSCKSYLYRHLRSVHEIFVKKQSQSLGQSQEGEVEGPENSLEDNPNNLVAENDDSFQIERIEVV